MVVNLLDQQMNTLDFDPLEEEKGLILSSEDTDEIIKSIPEDMMETEE